MFLRDPLRRALVFAIVVTGSLALSQAQQPPTAAANHAAKAFMKDRANADLGSALAQFALGVSYEKGPQSSSFILIPQDYREAAHWYWMAAEQGDKFGEYNLGKLYEDGHGVPKNLAIAAYWYEKAEQQGHSRAAASRKSLTDVGAVSSGSWIRSHPNRLISFRLCPPSRNPQRLEMRILRFPASR